MAVLAAIGADDALGPQPIAGGGVNDRVGGDVDAVGRDPQRQIHVRFHKKCNVVRAGEAQ